MEAGAVLAPSLEPSGVAVVFVELGPSFHSSCTVIFGLGSVILLLLLLLDFILGSCSQEQQDPVALGLLTPQ